jgi:membrane-associated protein
MMNVQTLLTWALAALAAYGYPIVFVATTLENVFIVGSFTPGDVLTAGAAVVAATNAGDGLSPWALVAVATLGSLLGANISYAIGHRGGRGLIERIGPRFGIDSSQIEAAEEFFGRHGSATIFLAKFVAVLKNVIPTLAGASRMNIVFFELYSLAAAAGYSGILVGVGWFLGENFRAGLRYFGAVSWLMFAALVAAGLWLWWRKRRHDQRLIAENAAEFKEEHTDDVGEGR